MSDPPGDLFAASGLAADAPQPLADRLRPARLDEVVGQGHLLNSDAPIGRMLAARKLTSLILHGPPGVGKTTIARLLAEGADLEFLSLSAVFSGVADLRKAFDRAERNRVTGRGTLLFVDEIHRFNKAQQDGLLPHVESGLVTLIGATTENPSFEINDALLSRMAVFRLKSLDREAMESLLARAEDRLGAGLPIDDEARAALIRMAAGDGRALLNLAERVANAEAEGPLGPNDLERLVARRAPAYDKGGDGHYDAASVLIKSIRGSDPHAALFWLARMLEGGEDRRFIARRLVILASEDVGLADPRALETALAAQQAFDFVGSPEGERFLAQAVIYLALAPKSNTVDVALAAARAAARAHPDAPPPAFALNAPTRLMKEEGRGAGYAKDHAYEGGYAGRDFFPEGVAREAFYRPTDRGAEARAGARLTDLEASRDGAGDRGDG